MNKFYIIDTTLTNSPLIFENIQGLVKHLEGTVKRTVTSMMLHIIANTVPKWVIKT